MTDKFFLDDDGLHAPMCAKTKAAWAGEKLPECDRGGQAPSTNGPAQVATDAYRDGWTRIFGKQPVGRA